MSEHENFAPRISEVAPGEQMTLSPGRIAIIGRNPNQADYIDSNLLLNHDQVTLNIPVDIAPYLSRAALLLVSKDGNTYASVPKGARSEVTAYNTRYEPEIISPGVANHIKYPNGTLSHLDFRLNGHTVRLRHTGGGVDDQNFRLDIDPTDLHSPHG
jgi:hypothetical protein